MKKEIVNKENLERRKFLTVLGIGTAGLAATKLASSSKRDRKSLAGDNPVRVSIHPEAVKRNKRGFVK
ncbi:MAG: hypothetical protein HZB41_15035 [Ignavibacteriae bacterium]|nr:hypothetical protein [Ignavibacteriota bacterium]